MNPTRSHEKLRLLLGMTEELLALSARAREARAAPGIPLLQRRQSLLWRLEAALLDPAPLSGLLGDLRARHQLAPNQLLLILLLLAHRTTGDTGFVPGRSLLEPLGGDLYTLLASTRLLHHQSPLFTGDIVRTRGLMTDSVLEGEYRLAEWVFHLFVREIGGGSEAAEESLAPGPYLSSAAHLLDLKHLVELYQMRAAGTFDDSFFRDCYPDADHIAADLTPMIMEARTAIKEREQGSGQQLKLPVVGLRSEFHLQDDEEIILLAVLFHEILTGPPLLDSGELIRLVSASEEEVFRKRRLLARHARLRKNGMVMVESEIEGKELMGEAYVAPWVEERLLEGIDQGLTIDADDCRTFHRFLQRLRNSDDFYRHL